MSETSDARATGLPVSRPGADTRSGVRLLVIPARYAYGRHANGEVPVNSVLVFVVRLDQVQ